MRPLPGNLKLPAGKNNIAIIYIRVLIFLRCTITRGEHGFSELGDPPGQKKTDVQNQQKKTGGITNTC
jgi:hypothetical protein